MTVEGSFPVRDAVSHPPPSLPTAWFDGRLPLPMEPETNNTLTSGSLASGLLKLSGPMLVSALLQNLQSIIDLFWVGRLGANSVAALAMSGTILMMLFPVFLGLSTGTIAFVSRNVGAGNHKDASDAAGQSLILAVLFGIVMGVTGGVFAPALCRLLGAEADVVTLGSSYLRISFLGSVTIFTVFIGNSILQGAGNTVIPMFSMILANVINLALDPLLIFGLCGLPRMGVRGAALATVLSQLAATVMVVSLIVYGKSGTHVRPRNWRLHPPLALKILRIGLPSSAQMLSRSLMSLVLMRIVASCGTSAVAAYGIGLRFLMISLMPCFSLGGAAATMVGQNLGAGKAHRATTAAWMATGMATTALAVIALLLVSFAPRLIGVFDSSHEVVTTGTRYLRTAAPFYVFAALAIVLERSMMGAGHTLTPMIITVVCLWGLQVPLAIALSHVMRPPTDGVWWSIAATAATHGLLATIYFLTGRWQRSAEPVSP